MLVSSSSSEEDVIDAIEQFNSSKSNSSELAVCDNRRHESDHPDTICNSTKNKMDPKQDTWTSGFTCPSEKNSHELMSFRGDDNSCKLHENAYRQKVVAYVHLCRCIAHPFNVRQKEDFISKGCKITNVHLLELISNFNRFLNTDDNPKDELFKIVKVYTSNFNEFEDSDQCSNKMSNHARYSDSALNKEKLYEMFQKVLSISKCEHILISKLTQLDDMDEQAVTIRREIDYKKKQLELLENVRFTVLLFQWTDRSTHTFRESVCCPAFLAKEWK
ncbi:hypothetical protein ACOME3_009482 [Neoechinorhynchus agilis]